jgi:hypothetical protein
MQQLHANSVALSAVALKQEAAHKSVEAWVELPAGHLVIGELPGDIAENIIRHTS